MTQNISNNYTDTSLKKMRIFYEARENIISNRPLSTDGLQITDDNNITN